MKYLNFMTYTFFTFTFFIALLVSPGCSSTNSKSSEMEGVKIGTQIWMRKNLDIPADNSCCPEEKYKSYGCLYTWHDAVRLSNQIEGWRLPTAEDWRVLEEYLGSPASEAKSANRSGGDRLKEIDAFNVFPGQCEDDNTVYYFQERAMYWALDTVAYTEGYLAITKSLYNKGMEMKLDKIYHAYSPLNLRKSVRLIKE